MRNLLFAVSILLFPSYELPAQCHAQFTWEQVPATETIYFHSTSTSEHDIVSWQWNFGDGHSGDGPNPVHTYNEPGLYLVCLVIADNAGCVSDICHEIVVLSAAGGCQANYSWEQVPGSLIVHFNSTSTSDYDIASFHWTFGDGHEGDGDSPHHTYAEPGTYLTCLTITTVTGCTDVVCKEIVVEGGSSGGCEADFNQEQLPGTLTLHFHSTSTGGGQDIISYQWNFGDGHSADGSNPYHTYNEPGSYVVCLIITTSGGCVEDVCHEIIVLSAEGGCQASFTWEQIPGSLEIHFNSTSVSDHDITHFYWTFGDGHGGDSNDPYHTYSEPGVYVVCLIIATETGCVDDVCQEIVVEGGSSGGCEANFGQEQLPGTLTFHFHSTSTGGGQDIISYQWNFGDGHFGDGSNPYHTYAEPGVYVVCLIITTGGGCVEDVCHEVIVEGGSSGECEASFGQEQLPGTLTFHFHSTSTGGGQDIISYQWNFGDGHSADGSNPYHTYNEPGIYVVCLIITTSGGCVADVCHEVIVLSAEGGCQASFLWDQTESLTVFFNSTSTSDHDIASFHWIFGDGHEGDGNYTDHMYEEPGIYVACLIITTVTGCIDDVCIEIVVAPLGAKFTFFTEEGSNSVQFYNHSFGWNEHTSWLWDFGDGSTSTEENPVHTYADAGVYTACLIMTDHFEGTSDTMCVDIEVSGQILGSETGGYPGVSTAGPILWLRHANPVRDELRIDLALKTPAQVRINLFSAGGQRVAFLDLPKGSTGAQQAALATGCLSSGMYVLRVEAAGGVLTRLLIVME